jgi:hypothetical protein
MNSWRTVRSIFQAFLRLDSESKIKFSNRLYLRVPREELTLVSLGIDNILVTKLSLSEATEVFSLIKSACDINEFREAKIGEWTWKIDGRLRSADHDHVVIQFSRALESTREVVQRKNVAAALANFSARFGPMDTIFRA